MNKNENNMDSSNTSSRIPKLRFPGFTGEWEELPLSHFLFEHKTKSDGKCEVHSVSVTKGVVNQAAYLGRSYAAADMSKYNLAKPNDIIYTKSPTGAFPYGIVKQNKNPYNVIVSPLYAVYTPINKYIGYILDSYFESPVNTNNYLSSLVQKGAKNTIQITNDTFISKSVCFPTDPAEQQKIAECLSELDNLISAQGQKVDALKEKKKGMMQQMFPQKGETVPRLRFSGFTGEWAEKKLGEMIIEVKETTTGSADIPLYSLTIEDGITAKTDKYERGFLVTKKDNVFKVVSPYDFVSNPMNLRFGAIDYNKNDFSVCVSGYYDVFRFKECGTTVFWSNYLKSDLLLNIYDIIATGSLLEKRRVYFSALQNLELLVPSLPEQQKIAECLSALDETIAAEADKLEALKNHKKGLMQQLFPQPAK